MAYSFSQLQTYLSCPLKYRFEKIDKVKSDMPSESLHLILGSCVHSALEELYKKVNDLIIPEKEELLSIFERLWNTEIDRAIKTFTRNPFDKETLESFYNRGVQYIEYYYNTYHPFNQAITMKTEMNIAFDMSEELNFRGKIDRLDIIGETMIINDYKTSRSLPKDGKNTIEDQVSLYGIGIKNDYGKQVTKIIGKVIYLHLQREYEWEITDEKIQETKDKYLRIMEEIEEKKSLYESGDEDVFPPTPGYACDNCLLKQLCPIYKHRYMTEETVSVANMGEMTIKHLIEEYAQTNDMCKQLDDEKSMLGATLVEFAKAHGCKRLYGDTKKLAITKKTTYSIVKDNKELLEAKLKEKDALDKVLDISSSKLGAQFKTNKLDLTEFKDIVGKKETTYISSTSNLKDDEMDLEVCSIE